MLTTLSPTPIRLIVIRHTPAAPIHTKWIGPAPRRRSREKRVPLARGVWVIPRQQWLPASALDVGPDVPAPDVAPSHNRHRRPERWTEQSLCAQIPTTTSDVMFFGIERREAPGRLIAAANKARKICADCPVAAACLTNALVNDERYGIWGGTSGRQREKLRIRLTTGSTVTDLVHEVLTPHELTA